MRYATRYTTLFENRKDELLLVARILMVILFVGAGWGKLTGFSGAVGEMAGAGLPIPTVAAIVAVIIEFFVGIAVVLGFLTRPLALLLAVYTLATAFIGHHYWTMTGGAHIANMVNFYKNVSITGGFLLMCITGPGRYSIDRE
ncbi:MAG: DoxX family protein [Rhodanobacteraceae bacterium]